MNGLLVEECRIETPFIPRVEQLVQCTKGAIKQCGNACKNIVRQFVFEITLFRIVKIV